MIRAFARNTKGASAVEFAIVAPVLISMMFGGLALGLAIWTQNLLQDAAQEAARCIAIGSSTCATVPSGCDSSSASVCYAETVAVNRGMTSIAASDITIATNVTSGGVSFTTVKITYPFSMIVYSYTTFGFGSFPNAT